MEPVIFEFQLASAAVLMERQQLSSRSEALRKIRKQRRGEPLTQEEREALGRWQRLSTWRKAVAIGGFAVGTFGLGFTLGGLVFGRWRKA